MSACAWGLAVGLAHSQQPVGSRSARQIRSALPVQPTWQCCVVLWCREMERKAVAAWRAEREATETALAAQSARQHALEQQHTEAVRQLRMAETKAALAARQTCQACFATCGRYPVKAR